MDKWLDQWTIGLCKWFNGTLCKEQHNVWTNGWTNGALDCVNGEHYVKNNTMYGQMVGSMDHWIVLMVHMYMNIM